MHQFGLARILMIETIAGDHQLSVLPGRPAQRFIHVQGRSAGLLAAFVRQF
jgi:hypothetical protein